MQSAAPALLWQTLAAKFSRDELTLLCHDLDLNPESVPYRERGIEVFAYCLVEVFRRQERLADLYAACARAHPNIQIDWVALSAETVPPADWLTWFDSAQLTQINTLSGTTFLGNVHIAGDFINRDKITFVTNIIQQAQPYQFDTLHELPGIYETFTGRTDEIAHLINMARRERGYEAYRRRCIDRWSGIDYALDRNFIRVTLMYHHDLLGYIEPGDGYEYHDLRDLLANLSSSTVVLLGSPGNGKSTLLRRLQLDYEQDQLKSASEDNTTSKLSFFVSLNRYTFDQNQPQVWLSQCWQAENTDLPSFDSLLDEGRLLLLLDGLNEIPHRSAAEYQEKVEQWRAFLQLYSRQGNRAVFTCRSLDYSASLSSESFPVAHANVKPLSTKQIKEFLCAYLPEQGTQVFQHLQNNEALLTLYATPYYLSMLVKLIRVGGDIPQGRTELFTFIVRQALRREVSERKTPLLLDTELLSLRDQTQINNNLWRGYALPERGALVPQLTALAFSMQRNHPQLQSGQVSLTLEAALSLLDHPRSDDILRSGEALGLLDEDLHTNQLAFAHQLFQEYFAARKLALQPDPSLAFQEWRSNKVQPSLEETLASLSISDPLPPLSSTGWEETMMMAAALSTNPDTFVRRLSEVNLPLAGMCAATSDVRVSDGLKNELRGLLVHRSQDQTADLRARIAVGLVLGRLGDPRFEACKGLYGSYLLPPVVKIDGGNYILGKGPEMSDVCARHEIEVKSFKIGSFPVTNAEFKHFVAAGGYEDERWWESVASKTWRRGESTNVGQLKLIRDQRAALRAEREDAIDEWVAQKRISSAHSETLFLIRNLSDSEFETWLHNGQFPTQVKYHEPRFWSDPKYNEPAQPVVGVCWYEALAYCKWLSAQTGLKFRLPTEAEWEAAARGRNQRAYAYGDQFNSQLCNAFESHIRTVTPVGIYRGCGDGENSEELNPIYDLTGNTWEWTSSAFLDYFYNFTPEREDIELDADQRVYRGGSYFETQVGVHATNRAYNHPSYRDYYVGFRIAISCDD